jgi:hypothetical protein
VLKENGRLLVSDIVLRGQLPDAVLQSAAAYVGCVAGASQAEDYLDAIAKAGFQEIEVLEDGGMDLGPSNPIRWRGRLRASSGPRR